MLQWIQRQGLLNGCGRVLLAVSGGADSIAMLHVLLRLREIGLIRTSFAVGHVNHQIRGTAADEDQGFVEQIAGQQGLEVFCVRVDVPAYARRQKLSLETAGRVLRIRALCEMAGRWGAQAVATAHHRDDQAETVIFRMLRGTGFRGLCGIRPISELEGLRFIRPMLGVSRREIEDALRQEGLAWRQDHTNADCGFARNRIRHQILPALEEKGGGLVAAALADLAQRCQSLFRRLDAQIERKLPMVIQSEQSGRMDLDRSMLADCSPLVLGEIFHRCLEAMDVGLRDYTARHYQELLKVIYAGETIQTHLPGGVEFSIEEKTVSFRRAADTEIPLPEEPVTLEPGGICRFGPFEIQSFFNESDPVCLHKVNQTGVRWTEQMDADKIRGPIRIRTRKAGDRFCPLGMKTEKKVGKFLTTARIDPELKSRVFIVEDTEKILWAAPVRISESVKVSKQTRRILRIQINQIRAG